MKPRSDAIHILDRLSVRPGRLEGVLAVLSKEYIPKIQRLGMTLSESLTSPIVLSTQPTELVLLWSVTDLQTYWKVRMESAADEALVRVWAQVDLDLIDRTRDILVPALLDLRPVMAET